MHWLKCEKTMLDSNQSALLERLGRIHRGSYMSAHVLLDLLNELGKSDKMQGLQSILSLFRKSLINSRIHEYEC